MLYIFMHLYIFIYTYMIRIILYAEPHDAVEKNVYNHRSIQAWMQYNSNVYYCVRVLLFEFIHRLTIINAQLLRSHIHVLHFRSFFGRMHMVKTKVFTLKLFCSYAHCHALLHSATFYFFFFAFRPIHSICSQNW